MRASCETAHLLVAEVGCRQEIVTRKLDRRGEAKRSLWSQCESSAGVRGGQQSVPDTEGLHAPSGPGGFRGYRQCGRAR